MCILQRGWSMWCAESETSRTRSSENPRNVHGTTFAFLNGMQIIDPDPNFPHAQITQAVKDALFQTHRELGYGFSEHVCRRALAIVLRTAGFEVNEEILLNVSFRGKQIGTFYADLVVDNKVLVEVKVMPSLLPHAQAQILNYLKAVGGGVGMLVNFGPGAQFKRFVQGSDPTNCLPLLNCSTTVE